MSLYHGVGRGSHIAGTSVHNQGIEHPWRDVFVSCTSLFYHLFHSLEVCGLLDPENDIHLYALQYVYLPRINQSLQLFGESWNQHPLTSCNCMTPLQLWMRGMLQNIHSGYTAVNDFLSNIPYRYYHCLTQNLFLTLSQKELKSGQLQFYWLMMKSNIYTKRYNHWGLGSRYLSRNIVVHGKDFEYIVIVIVTSLSTPACQL